MTAPRADLTKVRFGSNFAIGYQLEAMKSVLRPGARLATTYMPRGRSPTRAAAFTMAGTIAGLLERLEFVAVHVETLELQPVPRCLRARRLPDA